MSVLEHAGLIRVVATRQIRAVTEKFYGRVARLYVLKTDEDAEGVIGDNALAAVLLRQSSEELLGDQVDPKQVTAGLTYARLLPDDARRLGIRLNKLFADMKAAEDPQGEPFGLAGSFYPAPGALPPRSDDA